MPDQADALGGAAGRAEGDTSPRRSPRVVFVSYGHADADDFAQRLKRDLEEQAAATVWLDLERIEGGADWAVAIEDGIRGADTLLAVMTAHSLKPASVCQDEIVFAHVEGKHIVPLRLDADSSLRPTLLLVRRSWVDFTGVYADALSRLVRALHGDSDALLPPASPVVSGAVPLDFAPEIARHSRCFAGRQWLLRRLDEWLASERGRAFVVVGAPGIGKSAIAAHLCSRRDDVAAVHFCTTSNGRTLDANEFVAGVVGQLSRLPGYDGKLAGREPERRRASASDAFRELVVEPARAMPAPAAPLLIVVDALDEAVRRDSESIIDVVARQAAELPSWLRIVATSRPEAAVLERIRHLSPIEIDAAGEDNLADVAAYIEGRIHGPRLVAVLGAAAPQVAADLARLASGNFLYAALALDALGDGLLSPEGIAALTPGLSGYYGGLFRRAFPDADAFADELAPLLRCLSAALAPLPADVLARAADLPPERLNRRLRRARAYLRTERGESGLSHALFHRSLAEWLADAEEAGAFYCDVRAGHESLAGALSEASASTADDYRLRWLPRHLVVLQRWDELAEVLGRLDFLEAAWALDEYEVKRAWTTLRERGGTSPADAYPPERWEAAGDEALEALAKLFDDLGQPAAAEQVLLILIERARCGDGLLRLQPRLGHLGMVLLDLGRHTDALAALREQERLARRLGEHDGVEQALGYQALVFIDRGDYDEALPLLDEQECMCRELGLASGLQRALGHKAIISRARGDLGEALDLLAEQEAICRGHVVARARPGGLAVGTDGRAAGTGRQIVGGSGVHARLPGLKGVRILREVPRYCRELGLLAGLEACLGNTALTYRRLGDRATAATLLAEEEALCRELGLLGGLQSALGNQGLLACDAGDAAAALRLLSEQERICRLLDLPAALQAALGNKGVVLCALGDFASALAAHEEEERLCRALGFLDSLGTSLGNRGMLLWEIGDMAGAKELLAKCLMSCEARGDEQMMAVCRANLALIEEETP